MTRCCEVFPAALLGRMVAIPYRPLSDEMIGNIVRLQLDRVGKRVTERYECRSTTIRRWSTLVDQPLHRARERRPHDRRRAHQHAACPKSAASYCMRTLDGKPVQKVAVGGCEQRVHVRVRVSAVRAGDALV